MIYGKGTNQDLTKSLLSRVDDHKYDSRGWFGRSLSTGEVEIARNNKSACGYISLDLFLNRHGKKLHKCAPDFLKRIKVRKIEKSLLLIIII